MKAGWDHRGQPDHDGSADTRGSTPGAPRRESSSDRVAKKFAELIVSGNLIPGEYLPAENAIAAECGVSRPAVREGIRRLAAASVVETRHGIGTYVTPSDRWNLFDPLVLRAFLSAGRLPEIVDELLELRRMVEVAAAVGAARRPVRPKLHELRGWLERMDLKIDDPLAFTEADTALHQTIVGMSGNRFIHGITRYLAELFTEGRKLTAQYGGIEGRRRAQESHRLIVAAIERGDAEAARVHMEAHMEQFEEDMRRVILSDGEDDA